MLGQNLQRRVGKTWDRFADNTSMHGIGNIQKGKYILIRILWLCLFLACSVYMIVQLVQLYERYASNPKSTKVDILTSSLGFPSVSICNQNPVRINKLWEEFDCEESPEVCELQVTMAQLAKKVYGPIPDDEIDRRKRSVNLGHSITEDSPYLHRSRRAIIRSSNDTKEGDADYDYDYLSDLLDELTGPVSADTKLSQQILSGIRKLPSEDVEELGHHIETMLIKCVFLGRTCNHTFFNHWVSPDYGNCFTFNSVEQRDQPFILKRSGSSYGLRLVLNIESNEYMPFYTKGYGLVVTTHNHGTLAFPSVTGRALPVGYETSVGLTVRNISRLGHPWGNCTKGELFQSQYNSKYTYAGCEMTCIHRMVWEECACYRRGARDFLPIQDRANSTPCTTKTDLDCYAAIRKRYTQQDDDYDCGCEQPCLETEYMESVSFNQWPAAGYEETLAEEVCKMKEEYRSAEYDELCADISDKNYSTHGDRFRGLARKDFLSLNIYFKALNYEQIRQEPEYPLSNFLSDVGGTLGLYAGISVLTGAEVLMLLAEILYAIMAAVKESLSGASVEPLVDPEKPDPKTE